MIGRSIHWGISFARFQISVEFIESLLGVSAIRLMYVLLIFVKWICISQQVIKAQALAHF